MKILIMTDMEGVTGVLNHDDWVMPSGRFYDKGMRLLTAEVNAAIEGFVSAGAKELIVIDGHGAGGLDPETLHERAQLMRGAGLHAWPWGLDKSFDAVAVIGQHAKAGTPFSHITHTQWFNFIDMRVNDLSIGEYGQFALCAMELGIPTILACGEEAFCREAEALTPGVFTVSGKRGLLPDGLDALDTDAYRNAKLSAIHLSPVVVRARIRESARAALVQCTLHPESFAYPELTPPYRRTVSFRQNGTTPAYEASDEHPSSFIALMNQPIPSYRRF